MSAPAGLLFVDVSSLQGKIDFAELAAWRSPDGRRVVGVIARCSIGQDIDSRFAENRAGARAHGLRFGAYGVVYTGGDVEAQARAFCRAYQPADDDLPPAMDWETHGGAHEADDAALWAATVEHVTGHRCMVYTGVGFTTAVRWPASSPLSALPLWVAHYTGAAHPLVPKQWTHEAAWQYSGNGGERVAGIGVDVDRNVFEDDTNGDGKAGTEEDLAAFCSASKVGEPHPLLPQMPLADVQRAIGTTPDGAWGPKTEAALRAWQAAHGLTATGRIDEPTLAALAPHAPTDPPPAPEIAPGADPLGARTTLSVAAIDGYEDVT